MESKVVPKGDRLWLFTSLIAMAILYLSLTWRSTENADQLTTNTLFWGAIIGLLWRRQSNLDFQNDSISSFIGLALLGLIISKTFTLFWFESALLSLLPFFCLFALCLIASGFKGLGQYIQELFLAGFLFFPTGVIGYFVDGVLHITILNAKFASYLLYYLGFNVVSQGNEVLLSLPNLGKFKAIVDYPCAGVPMILLLLKLALVLIFFVPLPGTQKTYVPLVAIAFGFLLGVTRVCILTLLIPNISQFEYWHGAQGDQIFSTIAIVSFSAFGYWILETHPTKLVAKS